MYNIRPGHRLLCIEYTGVSLVNFTAKIFFCYNLNGQHTVLGMVLFFFLLIFQMNTFSPPLNLFKEPSVSFTYFMPLKYIFQGKSFKIKRCERDNLSQENSSIAISKGKKWCNKNFIDKMLFSQLK